ncbi:sensor histidine kinase [Terrisporobacter mayombei]|uniref:histidine kinase n=1 Tax=Terrisporobacter mayombei TaxID=1541 RepID=A0ABY9PX81_9FIRM|nr:HAMP domain-containing sensor histidine kinase [Terrisporobacter mayombei]MCC3867860.1 HAMP domain-containing histidine kinase [Terrisporobacter mayombei]WMT79994.1 Adaptive-response sensory-kinase SasA [Terrisporobacter mayombei]
MRKNKSKFYKILVRNYIAFTGVIIISIVCILHGINHKIKDIISEPKIKELVDYASLISDNDNNEINKSRIKKLAGKDTFIQLLDENNKVIYESEPGKFNKKYTKEELNCIHDYYDDPYIDIQKYKNDKNKENVSVSITYYDKDDNIHNKIYVVDDKFNLIYTNTGDTRKSFTENEFKYLKGTYLKGYDIRKYSFKDKDNEKLTLLINTPSLTNEIYGKILTTSICAFALFILIYIILIIIFIIWINRKVKRPINILNEAIVKFKNGERENYLDYDGPQEFCDICSSFNDMSRKLYNSEKKRESLEEEKQKILADISHDLKTPITVIKGYSKAVCDNLVSEEEKDQYLMTIYKKADHLDELINTFYEYSKLEHPDYKYVFEKVDLCEYGRVYLAGKYEELDINGVEIEADIPDEPIYCKLDRIQLKRVFENIISNSLKHNKKDLSILFEIEEYFDKVKINIADNGQGISKEIRKNIFKPFVVGEKSRTKKGSGLGLAISKKIVEAHGGSIKIVYARKNYKTEFEIILPRDLEI